MDKMIAFIERRIRTLMRAEQATLEYYPAGKNPWTHRRREAEVILREAELMAMRLAA